MGALTFKHKGNFDKTEGFFKRSHSLTHKLDKYGQRGVEALSNATPVDTGLTASSWRYVIIEEKEGVRLEFHNDNIQNGVPIAVIIQYGHATGGGGWVEGRDYINPVIRPLFDEMLEKVWREVKK